MNTRQPTMFDVAARAGVSHQTVSRVLNGHVRAASSAVCTLLALLASPLFRRSSDASEEATA